MIKQIEIRRVLPCVFDGMQGEEPLKSSEVWLRDVALEKGDYCLVEAESGTGKSSLCSFIYGSRGDYRGEILFDGTDVRHISDGRWCDIRTHSLAYLPQEMNLFGELTVEENINIKNRLTGFRSESWITDALERLNIADKRSTQARYLSVGQQQRVAIIRALCQPFDFLLLDEPVSHLDDRNNEVVAQLIEQEASALGAAVVATSVGNKIKLPFTRVLKL